MKKFIIVIAAIFGMAIAANANEYTIDDSQIDALIENAVEAAPAAALNAVAAVSNNAAATTISSKSDAASILLCFFLGGFGIHRHYMGTAPWMWAAYTFTFGGIFGVVPFVDFIVMIVGLVDDSGLGQYYGNRKFLMWA